MKMKKEGVVYFVGNESAKGPFEQALEQACMETGKSVAEIGSAHPKIHPAPVPKTEPEPEKSVEPMTAPALSLDLKSLVEKSTELAGKSDEEITRIKVKSRETKKLSREAGENLFSIQMKIRELERDPNKKFWDTAAKKLYADLKAAEAGLLAAAKADEALKGGMDFSILLETIRGTERGNERVILVTMSQVVKAGRARIPDPVEVKTFRDTHEGKYPFNTFWVLGQIYFSPLGENGKTSDGQSGLVAELRKMHREHREVVIARMKKSGSPDLMAMKDGKPGKYYGYRPKGEDKEGRKHGESFFLFGVYDRNEGKKYPWWVVEVLEVEGQDSWLKGMWMSLTWIRAGKPLTKRENPLPEFEYRQAMAMIGRINEACRYYGESLNKAKTAADTKRETAIDEAGEVLGAELGKMMTGAASQ